MPRFSKILFGVLFVVGIAAAGVRWYVEHRVGVERVEQSSNGMTAVVFKSEEVVDTNRTLHVRFQAKVAPDLKWSFTPDVTEVVLHPGEKKRISYTAENMTDSPVVGQAIHEVSPLEAGGYYHKIECFCFTRQQLGAHERMTMPLLFEFVPALPAAVTDITVTYTFFTVEGADAYAKELQKRGQPHDDHEHHQHNSGGK